MPDQYPAPLVQQVLDEMAILAASTGSEFVQGEATDWIGHAGRGDAGFQQPVAGVVERCGACIGVRTHMQRGDRSSSSWFSNIEAVEGEYSGFQFILLPSNEGDFVVFQQAEGWPQRPLLLELQREPTRTEAVRFEHPAMGRFEGEIHDDTLAGEFTRIQYKIVLVRGEIVW